MNCIMPDNKRQSGGVPSLSFDTTVNDNIKRDVRIIIDEILLQAINKTCEINKTCVINNTDMMKRELKGNVFQHDKAHKNGKDNMLNSDFSFVSNVGKMKALAKANELLKIVANKHKTIVFVYSGPKVGSTSIVSSLRIFLSDTCDILHIHDENSLKVLGNINNITVNELILYNKHLGKNVVVIDVYRTPIERKISIFFEKIGAYHFNNADDNINKYNMTRIVNRFNNIFPHLGNDDRMMDKYNIPLPEKFNERGNNLIVTNNGIRYVKLRLSDSDSWAKTLTSVFEKPLRIVKDYESANKPIRHLFLKFKEHYRIPINLLEQAITCKYFNYYCSADEIAKYYAKWRHKSGPPVEVYTANEYKLYETITLENSHVDYIQLDHYLDEGCCCNACKIKRNSVANRLLRGQHVSEKILHDEAKTDFLRASQSVRNRAISMSPTEMKTNGLKMLMSQVVKKK